MTDDEKLKAEYSKIAAEAAGIIVGKFVKWFFIIGFFSLVVLHFSQPAKSAPAPAKVEQAAKPIAKAKAVKHKKHKKQAKKKCACECKKVVDKPEIPASVIVIETPSEDLTNDATV